jgi:hypothetical protein
MFQPQNSPLIAYHNDPAEKVAILAQLAAHRAADELVKGIYWQDGKGCAVGCTIHGNDHSEYERRWNIAKILARLEDRIFEGLPNGIAKEWPERFMGAIAPGADLTMVWPRFAHWMMTEEVPPRTKNKRSLASLAAVGALYREWIDGAKPAARRWDSERRAIHADAADIHTYAAAYAADAAAYAAAAAAYAAISADAYAYAAVAAAAYASAAAYVAVAADAAVDAAAYASYMRQAAKLIELLQSAPVVGVPA